MGESNNSAARLLSFITICRKSEYSNKKASDVLPIIFDVPPNDMCKVLYLWSKVGLLPHRITLDLKRCWPGDKKESEDFLWWTPEVVNAIIGINYNANWINFINQIDRRVDNALKGCSRLLSHDVLREEKLSDAHLVMLVSLKGEINSLIDSIIANDDIDPGLRATLLYNLFAMKDAVECYSIDGAEPIQMAIVQSRYRLERAGSSLRMEDKSTFDKVVDIITKLNTIVEFARVAMLYGKEAPKAIALAGEVVKKAIE